MSNRINLSIFLLSVGLFTGQIIRSDPSAPVPNGSSTVNLSNAGPLQANTTRTVVPQGEYASIDTKPVAAVMQKLKSTVGHENDALIQDIEQNSGNYAPPVFFVLAHLLYNQGHNDDAIFWFNAGRLRANYDAIRCSDVSARSAVAELAQSIPVEMRKSQFNDPAKLQAIIDKVIKWDEATPYNYEYRWIDLHGMGAIQSGLGGSAPAGPLTVPQSTWSALAQQNRDDYKKGLANALADIQKKADDQRAEESGANVVIAQQPSASGSTSAAGTPQHVPEMKFERTIEPNGLLSHEQVMELSFSPDSRYLGILCDLNVSRDVLIIWNLEKNREQSRITGIRPCDFSGTSEIVWSQDGSYIAIRGGIMTPQDLLNSAQTSLWNPLTGQKIKDLDFKMDPGYSSFNRDGSKMLTISDSTVRSMFRIYDTNTWKFKDYLGEGLQISIGALCWTAEDKVLIVGSWANGFGQKESDGVKIGDILARLVDPSGKSPQQTVVLSPSVLTSPTSAFFSQSFNPKWNSVDYVENKIAVGMGTIKVLSGESLKTLYTYTPDTPDQGAYGDISFSPDGNYLYILDARTVGKGQSIILDGHTGKRIGTFPSGTSGLAISPDGKALVMGNYGSVKVFSIK